MGKPIWYSKTVRRLSFYQEQRRIAMRLREEIEASGPKTTAGYSLVPSFSGPGDSVGNLAEKEIDKREELRQVETELRIVEKLIDSLQEPKRMLIRMKYLEENKDIYVWKTLIRNKYRVKSQHTYYNIKDEAVQELAKAFGYVEKDDNAEIVQ